MVLAAGRGTRLGALGERTAKALIEVGGEPLLAHQLRYLGGQGVGRVVVNASHLAEQLERFAAAQQGPPELRVVREPDPLGTAGGVLNALRLFEPGPIVIVYGDVISGEDLEPMAELHSRHRPVATIATYHSDRAQQKGVLELSNSRVTAFVEKDPERTSGWVNAGIYIVERDWLAGWEEREPPLDFGFDLLPAALDEGLELRAHHLEAPVLDIGTPADLKHARERGLPQLGG